MAVPFGPFFGFDGFITAFRGSVRLSKRVISELLSDVLGFQCLGFGLFSRRFSRLCLDCLLLGGVSILLCRFSSEFGIVSCDLGFFLRGFSGLLCRFGVFLRALSGFLREFRGFHSFNGVGHLGFGTFDHALRCDALRFCVGELEGRFGFSLCQFGFARCDAGGHSRFQQRLKVVGESAGGERRSDVQVGGGVQEAVFQQLGNSDGVRGQNHSTCARRFTSLESIAQPSSAGGISIGDQQPRQCAFVAVILSARKVMHFNIGVGQMRLQPCCCGWIGVDHMDDSVVLIAHYRPFGHSLRPPLLVPLGVSSSNASCAQEESGEALSS